MIALDFETFYSPKYSVSAMSAFEYARHEEFDAYMVAIFGEGIEYVGPVAGFDWSLIHDKDICAHNASFDRAIFEYGCRRIGTIPPDIKPRSWTCTADMVAYLGCSRSLAKAANHLLKEPMSKEVRGRMKGVTYQQALDNGWGQELLDYCLKDTRLCLRVWEEFSPQWPEWERQVSFRNREAGFRGVQIDIPALEAGIDTMKRAIWDAEQSIPWTADGKSPTSPKELALACRAEGITPPKSTAKGDEECAAWEEEYSDRFPWIAAIRDWRRCNKMLKNLMTMQRNLREDGTMYFELKYCGAHTKRFSGSGTFNMQGLLKESLHGVNIRNLLIARPGHKFIIADLSQIEPRTMACLVNDKKFLEFCRTQSPYEAHARATMGWTGGSLKKEDAIKYALAKARVIALGYGSAWEKFISMAGTYTDRSRDPSAFNAIFHKEYTERDEKDFLHYISTTSKGKAFGFSQLPEETKKEWINSWKQVTDYRDNNPLIVRLWQTLDYQMRQATFTPDRKYTIELPSGNVSEYHDVHTTGRQLKASTEMGGPHKYLYGGKLAENLCQAVARDVFADRGLALGDAGYPIVFTVHDEYILEVPEDTPVEPVIQILCTPPEWFSQCPLGAEVVEAHHYLK